ncbi:MAG TPA: ATP-binding protein [Anaerolineales bacterium]
MKALLLRLAPSLRGLLLQLFVFIVLPLTALLIVFTFGSLSIHQNAMRSLIGERDERAVRTAAAGIGNQFEERMLLIQGLALRATPSAAPADLAAIISSSSNLLPTFDYGLAFYDRSGNNLASTGDGSFWDSLSTEPFKPTLQALLEQATPQGTISKVFATPKNPKLALLILVSIPGTGLQVNRIAIGALSPETLVQNTIAGSFAPGDQTNILMVDSSGLLIYSNGAQNFGITPENHAGVAEALQGKIGTAYIQTENKEEHVVAYAPIQPVSWALVTEESWETLANPTLRTTQVAPLVLVPVLLIMLAALWFSVYQIVRPLQALETRAAQVAWGDFQAIEKPVDGIAEIRHLQAELVHLTRKVQASQESLHGYIGAITAGQEEERRRLARELHDDTIQALIALKQRVQLAHLDLENGAINRSTVEALAELETLTEQTIQDLRRVTRALRPIYLEDLGLATALEMLVREVGQAANLAVTFHRLGTEQRLAPIVELALYRMVQEALTNIVRHSQATQAAVNIQFSSKVITLTVTDNGKGFAVPKSPAEFAPSGHYGLLGLQERAELIGAALKIQSSPGQGSELVIRLPISKKPS